MLRYSRTIAYWLVATVSFVAAPTASAQPAKILDGLLQDLLESQVERRQPRQRDQADESLLVPGRRSNRQVAPDRVPPVVMTASRSYAEFAEDAGRLVRRLRSESRTIPGVSSQLDDVLTLETRARLMSQKFSRPQKEDFILDNIRALDRDWRTTAHRLERIRGLSDDCRRMVTSLNNLNQRTCGLFQLQPQLDRRALVRLVDSLAAELHHLERDVEYEVRSQSQVRRLVTRIRRAEAKIRLLSDSIADGDAAEIVVETFRQFLGEWKSLSQQLVAFHDRHIDRTIEQVRQINRQVQEHLRMSVGVDREHVQALAAGTREHVNELGDAYSLSMLWAMPNPEVVVKAARQLVIESQHLCEEVESDRTDEHLVEHWGRLEQAWRTFEQHSQAVGSTRIRTLRRQISGNLEALRQTLGVQLMFDRSLVVRAVAELEGIAEQAQLHIAHWQRRPGARFDAGLIRASDGLIQDIHHLHEAAAGSASRAELTLACQQLAQKWGQLRPLLMACRTIDQRALRRIADDGTEKLIHLQTLLEQ